VWLGILLGLTLMVGPAGAGDTITQLSTLEALSAGDYQGQWSLQQLLAYGNFGLGTFDHLDGEMILLEGEFFQVILNGKAYRPSLQETAPYATLVRFKPENELSLARNTDLTGLKKQIDAAVPNQNVLLAIKVKGRFATIKVRSVPAQKKPFPPLEEVIQHQAVYELADTTGTLVGFRCPAVLQGATVPGYHLHFLTRDRQAGGHVLSFTLKEGHAALDLSHRFLLLMPEDGPSPQSKANMGLPPQLPGKVE
jgi:acetolactate decarboxylase